jgi:hypothetical protein
VQRSCGRCARAQQTERPARVLPPLTSVACVHSSVSSPQAGYSATEAIGVGCRERLPWVSGASPYRRHGSLLRKHLRVPVSHPSRQIIEHS